MEFVACLLGGIALVGCGFGLFRLRPPNWQDDGDFGEENQRMIKRWSKFQHGVRRVNNSLMILIGSLIVTTSFVPHGRAWVLLWSLILVLLLVCILMAMLDAFSSLAGYKRALPEAARRSFADHELVRVSEDSGSRSSL